MTENEITYEIRGAIFNVYNALGPGLLENIYEAAMVYELRKRGLKVESQKPVNVIYDGVRLPMDYRLDLLVEDKVIVELKSVEEMKKLFFKQLLTYLRIADKRVGILVNFSCDNINDNIHRIANNLK